MPQVIGRDIGRRYRIVDTLGQGGMGTVYRAKDRLGGYVALKQITAPPDEPGPPPLASASRRVSMHAPTLAPGDVGLGVAHALTMPAPPDGSLPTLSSSAFYTPPTLISSGSDDLVPPTGKEKSPHVNILVMSERTRVTDALRLTLAREFRVLSALRHPNIISVLDYGFDEDLSPYFTMELVENGLAVREAGKSAPFEQKLDLLVQILHALAYLHRRGVIHRDLKPSNVLVANDRVKVLDFGVSILQTQAAEVGKSITGTLPYMAPELLRMYQANELSDLYAVGMIAYELFADRYPFDLNDFHGMTRDILETKPDLSGLDPRIGPVIGRLLEKDPKKRYRSVLEVLAALNARAGIPLPMETAATRESFLQAAELVGRSAELNEVSRLLARAMKGEGGGVLIGGESGVGKSRLLEEIRARALVEGALALRGQEVSEGGGPYHGFRDILRWLALTPDLTDFEASVLKPMVPDIAALLEREVDDAPALDGQATQARFTNVVEDLLRRQEQPVVMLLEDIHWAATDSLKLLARVARSAAGQQALIIATYRDDERANLPSELPTMRVLKLNRLTKEGIAKLSTSMLGEAGCDEDVLSLLQRETEGNPFFLVEAVRVLAEEAGGLSQVGDAPLPSRVFAGGVHRVVERRLKHVLPSARPLLEAAAVIGRELDLKLLRELDPKADMERWIQACSPVLDVVEERFRFAHDKLREGLLANLTEAERPTLHRRVAEAIEAIYPDAKEWAAALAHHWAAAGDLAKEAHYAALAGEIALQSSAYREAVAFLERALAIYEGMRQDEPTSMGVAPRTETLLDRARREVKGRLQAEAGLVTSTSHAFRLGRLEGRLSEACARLGNHAEAFRHGALALKHLSVPMPSSRVGWVMGLGQQALVRAVQARWPEVIIEPSEDARAVLLEATRIQARITETCFFTQQSLEMLWSGLSVLNMGERAGPSPELARGYVLMGAVSGLMPIHGMANAFFDRALELATSLGRPYDIAFVRQRIASHASRTGQWKSAEEGFLYVMATADKTGDDRQRIDAIMALAQWSLAQGQFEKSVQCYTELDALADRSGDTQGRAWGIIGTTISKLRLGEGGLEAPDDEVQAWVDERGAASDVLGWYAARGLCHLRAGRGRQAEEAASRALKVALASRPVAYWTQPCVAAVAEIYLCLLEGCLKGAGEATPGLPRVIVEEQAKQACKAARAFASVFPIGEPFAHLFGGMFEGLVGKPARAREAFARCIEASRKLAMPYEEGRALFELGRRAELGRLERREKLEKAADIFRSLHAHPDALRVEAELEAI